MLSSLSRRGANPAFEPLMHAKHQAVSCNRPYRSAAAVAAVVPVKHQRQMHQQHSPLSSLTSHSRAGAIRQIVSSNTAVSAGLGWTTVELAIDGISMQERVHRARAFLQQVRQVMHFPDHGGRSRRNPLSTRTEVSSRTCLHIMVERAELMLSGSTGNMELDSCQRWLGQYPEVLEYAQQHGGRRTTTQMRTWLLNNPAGKTVLGYMGINPEELHLYDIDHMQPKKKGAEDCDHPINFFIMPQGENRSYGARLSLEKFRHITVVPFLALIYFRCCEMIQVMPSESAAALFCSIAPPIMPFVNI